MINLINITVKIFAVIFIATLTILKALGHMPGISVEGIVCAGVGMVGIFLGIDVSKVVQNVKKPAY